jgi:hypothetical protein
MDNKVKHRGVEAPQIRLFQEIVEQELKMFRSVFFRVVMALVLIGALVGIGAFAYRAGMMQGVAQSAQLVQGQGAQSAPGAQGAPVMPYYRMGGYGMPFGRGMMGFGFFNPLSCLVPLFLIFLVFLAFRGLFWHGPRMWGRHMHHGWGMGEGKDVPPFFEEWHRKMHDAPVSSEPTDKPAE